MTSGLVRVRALILTVKKSGFCRVRGEDASGGCGDEEEGLGGAAGVVRFEALRA